jgi:hypothetical protein
VAANNKVAAWFGVGEVVIPVPGNPGGNLAMVWGTHIRNASELPIVDVRVSFFFVADPGNWQPWELRDEISPPNRTRVIPPGVTRSVEFPKNVRAAYGTIDQEAFVVSIEFSDAAGNRWKRDGRGMLEGI